MNINPLGHDIGAISSWLHGLSRRQEAISENIANIDTPGYRARRVDFETELRRQLGRYSQPLATTDPRHLAGSRSTDQLGLQQAQLLVSQRSDGNTVDIDQEMVLLAETQMRYSAAANALNKKLDILRNVIRGV